MRMRYLLLTGLCVLSFQGSTIAQTAVDEFERGNVYYRDGQFEQAVSAYERILKQGLATPALYFNLGNAYYRSGKIAPAILAYERALRLEPGDPDIRHNLELVSLKTVDRIEPLPELFFVEWLHSVSAVIPETTTAWLFAVCWILFFGAISGIFLRPQTPLIRTLRIIAATSLLLLIPLGILLVTQVIESRSHNDAIITTTVLTAKTSPDAQGVDAFVIHEGLKVKLSDSVGKWVKITLADGKVGWIQSQGCERI